MRLNCEISLFFKKVFQYQILDYIVNESEISFLKYTDLIKLDILINNLINKSNINDKNFNPYDNKLKEIKHRYKDNKPVIKLNLINLIKFKIIYICILQRYYTFY